MDTLTLFSKHLNQRSLTLRWPLTPCLLRSHVWLYPRIIVSKSHDNTSMYVDTVINFAKYHIHTYTYYVHTTYYVQNEWSHSLLLNSVQARQQLLNSVQARQKGMIQETWIAKIKEIRCWTEELITFCLISPATTCLKKLPNLAVTNIDLSYDFELWLTYHT